MGDPEPLVEYLANVPPAVSEQMLIGYFLDAYEGTVSTEWERSPSWEARILQTRFGRHAYELLSNREMNFLRELPGEDGNPVVSQSRIGGILVDERGSPILDVRVLAGFDHHSLVGRILSPLGNPEYTLQRYDPEYRSQLVRVDVPVRALLTLTDRKEIYSMPSDEWLPGRME